MTAAADPAIAAAFLERLEPNGKFTFQTFDDSPAKRPELARILHGPFQEHAATLLELNKRGAGIFVTVNQTDGKGRKAGNVTGVRALYIDADGIPRPARWHIEPDIIVWRDSLHYHAYWLTHDVPLRKFTDYQKRLIAHYGSDKAVHDLSRVMRIPGYLHNKSAPTLVHFEDWRSHAHR